MINLHVQAKDWRHSARFHKNKIESNHVYTLLEMLSSTYLSAKIIEMDIFRQHIP